MPLSWPSDLQPTTSSFWLEANTIATTSQLSRATQTIIRPGARWRCDLTFEHRDPVNSARLDALIAQLGGAGEEAYMFDFRRPFPAGTAFNPAPAVPSLLYAAAPMATTIYSIGWRPNETIFQQGDYVGINGRLYINCNATTSDGSGNAPLTIRPALLEQTPAGLPITTYQPTSRFRLADGSQGANRTQSGRFSSYAISFIESLP
jgi:hypothetical protein